MADHDHIDMLKAAADPLRVAAALGIEGRGGRFFCPLCQPQGGKTPDLVIGDKGFICHKCGLKGDLLKLIEVAGDMDFPSAVAWLEEKTGIPSPGRRQRGVYRVIRAEARKTILGHPGGPSTPILSRSRSPRLIPPYMKPS
jgi:hypothetical protein